jgi:hypothetical protein
MLPLLKLLTLAETAIVKANERSRLDHVHTMWSCSHCNEFFDAWKTYEAVFAHVIMECVSSYIRAETTRLKRFITRHGIKEPTADDILMAPGLEVQVGLGPSGGRIMPGQLER